MTFAKKSEYQIRRAATGPAIITALNAAAVVPFFYLIAAVFSHAALQEIESASRVSLGIAGLVGSIVVLSEVFRVRY